LRRAPAVPLSFSVVVPLYNKEKHVERALRSALGQSLPPLELIVVDDGSTDGGAAVVERIADEDGRIKLLRQPNGGVSRARNAGIAASRGSHVAFLDADDEWEDGFLEEIAGLAARFPEAGSFSTGYRIVESGGGLHAPRLLLFDPRKRLLLRNYFRSTFNGPLVWTSATVVPRTTIEAVGGFLDGAWRGEDLELWWRIGSRYAMAFSRARLAIYHKDADNRSEGQKDKKPSAEDGKRARWWGVDRLEALAADETITEERRRWMRELIAWYKILAAYKRYERGNPDSGLREELRTSFGHPSFAHFTCWVALRSLAKRIRRARA